MDLGELVGSLRLEDSQFGQAISGALEKLVTFQTKGIKIAGAAGAAIALAVGASIVANLSLEAANDKLAAELGFTEDESAKAGKIAGQLYADNYGESLGDVNNALAGVITSIKGMREASDAEISAATANALTFANVFDVDVQRAVQVAGQSITTGLAKDSTEAFDLMTKAAQGVPKALRGDLLDAIDEYGPAFAQLGYSGEEAFALLVDASEKGMYGIDKAGDALKEFTIRATDMSVASTEAYDAIGLDAEEMSNKILAGGDVASAATNKIVKGLLDIKDPATQANTAIALFGTPIEDLSTKDIPAFLQSLQSGSDSMDGFTGAAERMDQTLNDNAAATLSKWKRQLEQAFLGIGNWAVPAVEDLIESIDDLLDPIGGAGGAAKGLAAIVGVILVPALIAWGVQSTVAAAKSTAAWLATQWGAMRAAASTAVAVAGIVAGWILMGIQATASALRVAAAWLIAMGPIGIAIAGFVYLVVKHWDTIKEKTGEAWDWIVDQVKKVPGLLYKLFLNFTLIGLVIKHWDTIKNTFSAGGDAVVTFMRSLPGRILKAVGNLGGLLLRVGEDIMRGLRDGIDNGFEWIRSKLGGLGKLIPGWLKKVLGISSPSTEMRDEVGQWIPAGVADGIDKGTPRLQRAVEDMADSVVVPITAAPSYGAVTAAQRAAQSTGGLGATGTDGAGVNLTQYVYPTEGMSEQQIGDAAANRLLFALDNK